MDECLKWTRRDSSVTCLRTFFQTFARIIFSHWSKRIIFYWFYKLFTFKEKLIIELKVFVWTMYFNNVVVAVGSNTQSGPSNFSSCVFPSFSSIFLKWFIIFQTFEISSYYYWIFLLAYALENGYHPR